MKINTVYVENDIKNNLNTLKFSKELNLMKLYIVINTQKSLTQGIKTLEFKN